MRARTPPSLGHLGFCFIGVLLEVNDLPAGPGASQRIAAGIGMKE